MSLSILTVVVVLALCGLPGSQAINTLKGRPVCVPCRARTCPPAPRCRHGYTRDQCGCCLACVRHDGEMCGGHYNIQGQCRRGSFCFARNSVIHDYQEGVCRRSGGSIRPARPTTVLTTLLTTATGPTTTTTPTTTVTTPTTIVTTPITTVTTPTTPTTTVTTPTTTRRRGDVKPATSRPQPETTFEVLPLV